MGPVLCLNVGSSTLKFALFEGERRVFGETLKTSSDALEKVLALVKVPLAGVGHRLVYGGERYHTPELVDKALLRALHDLEPFAPLHLPRELAPIEQLARLRPALPQVVCFDTAFHRAMPLVAQRYPLPRALFDEGVRRYGFHGLSYEYIVSAVPGCSTQRTIIAHLGNGASLVALQQGQPLETTMGFTPAGGLMMGTRPGDLDPGVLLYLEQTGVKGKALSRLINEESGLVGVSGRTSDMKELLAANDRPAAEAVELFCYLLSKSIGALAAVLGGLDQLIFTGGIGERAPAVRARSCERLGFLGIQIDEALNRDNARSIATGPCKVLVIPTHEDQIIARHTVRLLQQGNVHASQRAN